jgi:hypothetical protein
LGSFKNGHIEAVSEEVRCGADSRDTGTDNGNMLEWLLRLLKLGIERREDPRDDYLDGLVDERDDPERLVEQDVKAQGWSSVSACARCSMLVSRKLSKKLTSSDSTTAMLGEMNVVQWIQ